jgi:hypothetical protein
VPRKDGVWLRSNGGGSFRAGRLHPRSAVRQHLATTASVGPEQRLRLGLPGGGSVARAKRFGYVSLLVRALWRYVPSSSTPLQRRSAVPNWDPAPIGGPGRGLAASRPQATPLRQGTREDSSSATRARRLATRISGGAAPRVQSPHRLPEILRATSTVLHDTLSWSVRARPAL